MNDLTKTAQQLVDPKKGILAADWSVGTATKHFEKNGFESTEETRRRYRQAIMMTEGYQEYIGGVILHEETARQKLDNGKTFPEYLEEREIIPGVRADEGYEELQGSPKEKITKGIKTLEERLGDYEKLGLKFTKWRSPFLIDEVRPSKEAIEKNTDLLAGFAHLSQKKGLIPIVEPEVLLDGNHTMAKCEAVTKEVLKTVFNKLEKKGVVLKEALLKPNMVLPGKDSSVVAESMEVGHSTFRTMKECVPSKIPGLVFLSGGQTPEQATSNLNAINKVAKDASWELTFSFARALQYPAIEIYRGKQQNVEKAQKAFLHRAKLNSLARQGKYDAKME